MERFYEFAGVEICVSAPAGIMFENEGRLRPFAGGQGTHRFTLERVENLSDPQGVLTCNTSGCCYYQAEDCRVRYLGSVSESWRNAYLRVEDHGTEHKVQLLEKTFPGCMGVHTLLGALGAEHLVIQAGGVILHASYILHEGRAILFTAPSETGKSTQAELWKDFRGARIINGDRAVIRIVDGTVVACGIPFAGSSQYCENVTAPLAAIVCLGQAPKTQAGELHGFQAFRRVWEGCSVNTWDRTDVEMAAGLLQSVLGQVPVFQLDCTPDESAVIALENILKVWVKP